MHTQWDITPFLKKPRLGGPASFEPRPPTQQPFVLNKSWVLSYLRHRNSRIQKLLRDWVQALGATISGIL